MTNGLRERGEGVCKDEAKRKGQLSKTHMKSYKNLPGFFNQRRQTLPHASATSATSTRGLEGRRKGSRQARCEGMVSYTHPSLISCLLTFIFRSSVDGRYGRVYRGRRRRREGRRERRKTRRREERRESGGDDPRSCGSAHLRHLT